MTTALQEGTHGGFDLLDKDDRVKADPDKAELTESLNERTSDLVDVGLSQVLGEFIGGYITNKTFETAPVAGSSVPDEVEFDRFYYERKILVDMFDTPYSDEEKSDTASIIAEKRAFAKSQGFKYLAIVGTEMPVSEVREAIT